MTDVEKILSFLKKAGINTSLETIEEETFLPGLKLKNGCLIIDSSKMLYPGDMLHEAGHLATMPPSVRGTLTDPLPDTDLHRGGEMMAIAWSYAACLHIGLPPEVVFHPDGYKGMSAELIKNFSEGKNIGLPLLQWAGMTYDQKKAMEFNTPPYPNMTCWLREENTDTEAI